MRFLASKVFIPNSTPDPPGVGNVEKSIAELLVNEIFQDKLEKVRTRVSVVTYTMSTQKSASPALMMFATSCLVALLRHFQFPLSSA